MSIIDRILGRSTESAQPVLTGELQTALLRAEVLESQVRRLEFSREDAGWQRIADETAREFTREGLNKNADLCRAYTVANPLVKRASQLRASYVFGQGVGTTAKGEAVNEIVQHWLDDPEVRETFSGAEAQLVNEQSLFTDGNVFFALFTSPLDGRVRPRKIPFEEIAGTLTNPEDKSTTWFYRRSYSVETPNGGTDHREELYPAMTYRPINRPARIGGLPVHWDTPIYHVRVNHLEGWKFGIGDAFAMLPWARGHKEFLENWALMMSALTRITFQRVDTRGKNTAKAARAEVQKLVSAPAGSVVNSTDGSRIEAVPKTGATIDGQSSLALATMAAASVGLPVTMLLGDPGQTGARAVAETLDHPTQLTMQSRQEVWREARRAILGYVIDQAALAPRGALRGLARPLRDNDRLTAVFRNEEDRTLEISFPDVSKTPLVELVGSIVDAAPNLPPKFVVQELLRALGARDVDEYLDQMFDEDGRPLGNVEATYGNAAVQAVRRGDQPPGLD